MGKMTESSSPIIFQRRIEVMSKTTLKQLIYRIVLYAILISGYFIIELLVRYSPATRNITFALILVTIPLLIGMMLGIESLLKLKDDKYNNWFRFMTLGLPAFLFILLILMFNLSCISIPVNKFTIVLFNEKFFTINALIVGYVLGSSLNNLKKM